MTKTTTNLLGILITILAGTYFFVTYCSECGANAEGEAVSAEEEMAAPVVPEATSYPFTFADGDFSCDVADNFNFNVSSSAILQPVSADVESCIANLTSFLNDNDGKVINITGYYHGDESNNTAYPNLGLARANAVKNFFVSKGIPSSRMNTFGKLMGDLVPRDNVYLGPLEYAIGVDSEDTASELQALREKIIANPLIMYFDTAEAAINLTAEQRQKVADISRYLDKVDGATANIVGHTDNTGERSTNIQLGQERADFAKAYFMRNGISEAKLNASSEGPDSPVASNDTEEGRAQNRRTEVTLN